MINKNLYYPLWRKYLAVIAVQMKNAVNGEREITIPKTELNALGERKISEFLFSLEIKNAKVLTNIRGVNMAKDFVDILNESKTIRTLLENGHFTFGMAKDYILRINVVNTPVETEAVEAQVQAEITPEPEVELNSLEA
jgi:hypothetical protein